VIQKYEEEKTAITLLTLKTRPTPMLIEYPATGLMGLMKRFYNSVLELGVHEDAPVYEMHRVRFSNFIGLFCQSFYLLYVILSFVLHSHFLTVMTLLMLVTGIFGFWLNHKRHYNIARSIFITSFSVLLFFICNTLNIGFILYSFISLPLLRIHFIMTLKKTYQMPLLTFRYR